MASTNWLSDDEMRLWRAFLAATSAMGTTIDASMRAKHSMTLDDYEVLVHLSEATDHRLRMSELSGQIMHSRSRLTQRVDRLEERGFVARAKCDDDARGTWAILTDEGMAAIEKVAPSHLEDVRNFFFDHVDPADLPVLVRSFEEIAAQLRS